MKRSDLLDLMGEIDSAYIEDAASHLERSPRRLLQRWARPASAVAVAGFMGFSFFVIYGIVRDGIASQNPSSGYESAAYAPETTLTADTVPPEDCAVQTETIVITTVIPAETTTETTVSTLIPTYEIPTDEKPNAAMVQEVGSRFSVNWLSDPGILAMTVHTAQYFDSIEDAGLTFGDLTYAFRSMCFYETEDYPTDENGQSIPYMPTEESEAEIWNQVQAKYEDYCFVKLTITVENINALAPYWLRIDGQLPNGSYYDNDYIRNDYDFDMTGMQFGVIRNPDFETEKFEIWASGGATSYFSLCGQAYPKNDQFGRGDFFYLEPGETMTCEVGGFLPKTSNSHAIRENYWTKELHYEENTDLRPYYYFGGGPFHGPYIMLNLAEEQKTEE